MAFISVIKLARVSGSGRMKTIKIITGLELRIRCLSAFGMEGGYLTLGLGN